jgi:hypothetical protein
MKKRTILKFFALVLLPTPPAWVRHVRFYFLPILFPIVDHLKYRKDARLQNAQKAVAKGTASEKMLCFILSKSKSLGEIEPVAMLLFKKFPSPKTGALILMAIRRAYAKFHRTEIKKPDHIKKLMIDCFYCIAEPVETKEAAIGFLEKYQFSFYELPELKSLLCQVAVKYLSKVSQKNILDDMIRWESLHFHMYSISADEQEVENMKSSRLMQISEQGLSREECQRIFKALPFFFEKGAMADNWLKESGYDLETYEQHLSGEEKEKFEKKFIRGDYFLYRKICALVLEWSIEDFQEPLNPTEYYGRIAEIDRISS